MLRQENTKKQGDVGLGVAIGWLACNGYTVCVPLTDSQDYDLVADIDGLKKIQVKTTTYQVASGSYSANLSVKGGNRTSRGNVKKFNGKKIDFLFVFTGDDTMYLIPTTKLENEHSITLGKEYDKFRVGDDDGGVVTGCKPVPAG